MNYETGAATGKSRLVGVTECASNGDCLNPTTFAWQKGEVGLAATAENTGIPDTNALYTRAIDVNGDGKTDIVYPTGTTWKVRLSQGVNFSPEIDTGIDNTGYQYARPIDFNADGRIDMLVPFANGRWYLMRATGSPAAPFATPTDTGLVDGGKAGNPQLLDINGDGYPDIVHPHDSYWYSALGNGAGFGADTKSNMPYVQNGYGYYAFDWGRPADFQGDGLADVLIPRLYRRYPCGGFSICEDIRWDALSSPGAGPLTLLPTNITANLYSGIAGTGVINVQRSQQAIDINRDGSTDLLTMGPNGSGGASWWLCQNWGGDLVHCSNTTFAASTVGQFMIQTDWNSDGKPDMLAATNGGTANWAVYQTNSNGLGMIQLDSGIPQQGYDANPLMGDFNGDGLLDLMLAYGGMWNLRLHNGPQPDQLVSITGGLGATRTISYKPLTDNAIYTKGSGAVFPQIDVQDATYVVSKTAADDGVGGQFRNGYRYAGARSHLTGRGFLGFATLEQTDLQTGIVTRTSYRQDFPYIGMPVLATKTSSGGVELSRVENTYAEKVMVGSGKFPYLAYSKGQSRDLNTAALPTSETWNETFDDWGNVTKITTQTSDGFLKQTNNTYTNDPANWLLGRLTRASVINAINGWSKTRVSAFEYNASTGLLTKEIIEPDAPNGQFRLDTTYTHDAFGNRKTAIASSPATGTAAIVTRTTTTTYDARGQFPVTVTNALGHTESKTYDPRFGTVARLTGPNALTTTWQVDSFGRKTREDRADGTKSTWTYVLCDAACPGNAVYRAGFHMYGSNDAQAAPIAVDHFDRLNRSIRMSTQGFDGRWIYKDTQYDNQGRVAQVSRPYYPGGDPIYWARSEYDALGRVVKAFESDAPTTPALTVVYNGLSISRSNRKNQTTTEISNSAGQKVSVTDASLNTTQYTYDPFGNLSTTVDPVGNQIINFYDIRGRKTKTIDPDLGLWSYAYNALGELVRQTDAKGQVTNFKYDLLGRMTQRVAPGLTSDWVWDTAVKGKGKLQRAKTNAGYIRAYIYDNFGRIAFVNTNSGDGNALGVASAYDTSGRIASTEYPSGLIVKSIYNTWGYLAEVRNAESNALYWAQNAMDVEGHSVRETYGSGVVTTRDYQRDNGRLLNIAANAGSTPVQQVQYLYDTIGNVRLRIDDFNEVYDTNLYDSLNRLIKSTATIGGVQTITNVAYDALGNLTSKTGVGTYTYGDPLHPHAATQAGANAYSYDRNGNLISGGGRSATWTAWNMPQSITESGQTTTWLYTPEHDRYKMIAPGRTTWYLNPSVHQGSHYERTQYASGTVEHRHTLYGGGAPIGEVVTFDSGAPAQTRYFHSDAQGSITAVTSSTGVVINRYRYDPWGKQTVIAGSNTGIAKTRQGHTGHEMLDGGLTHMNGRLYDPSLARFVSADPYVDNPYNLQSLNRYSYVWNNPLGYTDPTGYFGWEISPSLGRGLFMMGGMMFGAVLGPAGPIFAGGGFATTVASGALAGGVSGFIGRGGNAQAARQGALAGGLFAGAGQLGNSLGLANDSAGRALLHAAAGCISASAGGGSCGTGAMTAGFTKFASSSSYLPDYGDFGNLVKYAVIGGTASAIGGDKFANGAMTGAWQYLFNSRTLRAYLRNNNAGLEVRARFLESKIQELGGRVPEMIGRPGSGVTETYVRALEARFEQVVSRIDASARVEFRKGVVSEVLLTGNSTHGLTRTEIDYVRENHRLPSGFAAHHREPISVNPLRAGDRDNLELLRHGDHVQRHRELRGLD